LDRIQDTVTTEDVYPARSSLCPTSEDVELLHAALDPHPGDTTLRLALADALRDCGSPLGDGYEALARLGVYAHCSPWGVCPNWAVCLWPTNAFSGNHGLPSAWGCLLRTRRPFYSWFHARTRCEVEDAVAAVFPELPDRLRRQYLRGVA
jgi:hypothetical protein